MAPAAAAVDAAAAAVDAAAAAVDAAAAAAAVKGGADTGRCSDSLLRFWQLRRLLRTSHAAAALQACLVELREVPGL